MEAAEQFRETQRTIWGAGDWPGFAPVIQEVSDIVVEELGVGEGHDYLDIACGSGNAAIVAARRGARVIGLDFVPKLVEAARERAAAEGLDAEFVQGDAEDLPFADDSFDRATSIFGVMFAPRHQQAADELVRIARPGGVFAVTGWTPEGLNGQMFKTVGAHMPPSPEGMTPPAMWGDEEHVRGLFSRPGLEVSCEKRSMDFTWESLDSWFAYCEQNLGPTVVTKSVLEPQGKWEAARADLIALGERFNEAGDGSMRTPAEYLLTKVTVA
ncbi:MAG: class I SAM-dependent methyltransferase [Solirubrobacterales bacterium]|nr:class I SAM-dependent methyltransferase [Solirubrobacterales bacterium]